MRIALDCRSVFRGMGGIGRYTFSLLTQLVTPESKDEYVCYFTHLDHPSPIPTGRLVRSRSFQAGMIDERFDQLVLPSLLLEDEIDLYHNPSFAVPLIRTRARTVSTVHDVVFKRHPELVEPRLRAYLDRATQRAARHADHLITVSDFSRSEIASLYAVDPKRITAIPNGVDLPPSGGGKAGDFAFREAGLAPGRYVLYVGRIEEKKNISRLLLAWQGVSRGKASQGLTLALAGSWDPREYPLKEKIRELALEDSVRVLGYVPAEVLEALYGGALLFVYPSIYEGFGLPPLEAMARGVPTIVSSASSLPEVVGEDAVKVDPERPEDLTRAILDLIRQPEKRQELSTRGRKRAAGFTWAQSAFRHREVYQSVMRAYEDRSCRV